MGYNAYVYICLFNIVWQYVLELGGHLNQQVRHEEFSLVVLWEVVCKDFTHTASALCGIHYAG